MRWHEELQKGKNDSCIIHAMRITGAMVLLLGVSLLASCAGVPDESPPNLVWPIPPEKPRIRFLDLVIGSIDVVGHRKGKFKSLVFGDAPEIRFIKPSFVEASGDVMYVTDIGKVHVYDFGKRKYTMLGADVLRNATGIALSSEQKLYVGDTTRLAVYIFDLKKNTYTEIRKKKLFASVGGVALDEPRDRLFAVDAKNHRINVFTLDGDFLFHLGKRGAGPAEFNFPVDLEVDEDVTLYVVDAGNFRIQILDKDGNFIRAFGSVGLAPGMFARPKGIARDRDGHLYVIDATFSNFQIFDEFGRVYLAVGGPGADAGQFLLPMGICIDEQNKVYVADQLNRRMQIFQYIRYPEENP
jgi:DNA-binding beta-propeller fold protein YncE